MSKTRIRLQMMREVAEEADSEPFYATAKSLGETAAQKMTGRHRSQITDLKEVADTAMKVTDVLNHVKNQTARRAYWLELGPALLDVIETDLAGRKASICARLTALSKEPHERAKQEQQIHLSLIREFVRQLAAHYEYRLLDERGLL